MRVIEFKATGHYVLPLTLSSSIDRHDPLSYVTGAMTKLADNESITLQLVVQPVVPSEAPRLARRILSNEDILSSVSTDNGMRMTQTISNAVGSVMLGITDLASEVSSGLTSGHRPVAGSGSYASPSVSNASFRQQVLNGQQTRPDTQLVRARAYGINAPEDHPAVISGEHPRLYFRW